MSPQPPLPCGDAERDAEWNVLIVFSGTSSELYFRIDELLSEFANPSLHVVFPVTAFKVEMGPARAAHPLDRGGHGLPHRGE